MSPLAELEIELREERNPAIKESEIAEATLHLKGVTLRASERSTEMGHSINLVAEDLARQVKRHRDKRRARREGAKPHEPHAASTRSGGDSHDRPSSVGGCPNLERRAASIDRPQPGPDRRGPLLP